jgi:cell division protein FtsL
MAQRGSRTARTLKASARQNPMAATVLCFAFFGTLVVLFLLPFAALSNQDRRLRHLERRLSDLQRRREALQKEISTLRDPSMIADWAAKQKMTQSPQDIKPVPLRFPGGH